MSLKFPARAGNFELNGDIRQLGLDACRFRDHNVLPIRVRFSKSRGLLENPSHLCDLFGCCNSHILSINVCCERPGGEGEQSRKALEQMRDAIDHYRGTADRGKIMTPVGSRNYPADLETLVKGASDARGKTIQFLSKIP